MAEISAAGPQVRPVGQTGLWENLHKGRRSWGLVWGPAWAEAWQAQRLDHEGLGRTRL